MSYDEVTVGSLAAAAVEKVVVLDVPENLDDVRTRVLEAEEERPVAADVSCRRKSRRIFSGPETFPEPAGLEGGPVPGLAGD